MGNTVLIADDAEFMRVMLRDILADMDLEIVGEASDGKEAVALYRQHRPDLVAMDITMPKLNGIKALKQIMAEDPGALVVMITALGQKEKVLESIQAGARDFIIKPFDYERVQTTIGRLLEKAVA